MVGVTRTCCVILKSLLVAGLVAWTASAPLVWVVRDGLGPKSADSVGTQAAYKFAVGWGVPAFAVAMPLLGLVVFERLLKSEDRARESGED
jgi:hypothetical protein